MESKPRFENVFSSFSQITKAIESNHSNPNIDLSYPLQFGTSYGNLIPEIQILVIDNDKKSLVSTTKKLELCSYQVTKVDLASKALKIISSGKKHFDVVIADINSDIDGFHFCKQVVEHGILVLLTSANEATNLATKAMENGAFLFMKKPLDEHIMKYLWQFVMKEKLRSSGQEEGRGLEVAAKIIKNGRGKGIIIKECTGKNYIADVEKNTNGVARRIIDERKVPKRTHRKRKHPEKLIIDLPPKKASAAQSYSIVNYSRKKVCTEWTKELHEKFMDAVKQLGEGKCYPKEIMEIMNVPGLTRMQVASHLQKCRHDNWRAPEERRYRSRTRLSADSNGKEREKIRVFGSMPRREEDKPNSVSTPLQTSSPSSSTTNTTTIASYHEHGECSSLPKESKDTTPTSDHRMANFTCLRYDDDDELFPSLETLSIDEIRALMWDVDAPVGLWDEKVPFPVRPSPAATTMSTFVGPPAPPPVVQLDLNQRVPTPREVASEPVNEIDQFFAKDSPDFFMAASEINNDSQGENFPNDISP